ncbi:MAG TPA: glucose-6-phosphate dehydrogenase assembly protein OpcA [Dermatophilaceae bacterium]|nr:glucose-6-phosphate dehydrogenase assembly protein OpcA [Dermatophilaceae bacterium]
MEAAVIVDLPSTTTGDVARRLVALRADVGSMALSRVLTLVVVVDEQNAEAAIDTANDASHQHPCRIIVVVTANRRGAARLDAQIRLGGDAGASEVVVFRLYGGLAAHGRSVVTPLLLADSPIVAWWPVGGPAEPATDPIGAMAQRRMTDAARASGGPRKVLSRLAAAYQEGDTDLSWARITLWRGLLAATLDQGPFEPVTAVTVTGAPDSPSADLLAAWLAARLRCPVTLARSPHRTGVISVRLERRSGPIDLVRPQDGDTVTLSQPGQPQRTIALPHRSDAECLADELRRLDPDEVYQEALTQGMALISTARTRPAREAVRAGAAPDEAESARTARRLQREAKKLASAAVADAPPPSEEGDEATVRRASRSRLAEAREKRSGS